jgi:nucleoside-diphosphate-sugar epimerase
MDKKDKRIFVTGATGFVGSYLVRYLVKCGYTNIIALKRSTSPMDLVTKVADKVTWAEGDVLDAPFLEDLLRGGIDEIYHCAAVISFSPRDRETMYRINVEGTANIVNLALDFKVRKLVHVSSIAAIGRVERDPYVSENTKWQRSPINSHYAISKFQAEQEVWRGIAEGLTAAIVNPSVIVGSQFWHQGTGKLFEQVWKGLRFYTEGVTGYVDVRDVVRFMVKLMESDIDNQRFILNSENLKYKIFFEEIAKILHKKPATIKVTPLLRELAWRAEWLKSKITGQQPLITKETARISGTTFYFNNEKSLKAFPDFTYTPILNTIKETGEQFLKSKESKINASFLTL